MGILLTCFTVSYVSWICYLSVLSLLKCLKFNYAFYLRVLRLLTYLGYVTCVSFIYVPYLCCQVSGVYCLRISCVCYLVSYISSLRVLSIKLTYDAYVKKCLFKQKYVFPITCEE